MRRRRIERDTTAGKKQNTKGQRTESASGNQTRGNLVLQLQRTIGNQTVQDLVKSGELLTKLEVDTPGSKYERKADRIAEAVMRMPDPSIQEPCPECERELHPQSFIGRKQANETISQSEEGRDQTAEVTSHLETRIKGTQGSGQPLPESVRSYFEPRFGVDFSEVRIHTGSRAHETAQALAAKAVTVGRSIIFSRQRYQPGSSQGKHLLAHELAHVTQNRHRNAHASPSPARLLPEIGEWWDCIKGGAVGFGGGIWDFIKALGGSIWSPIKTIKNAYNGIRELINIIRQLELGEAAKQAFPKIYTLATQWSELSSYRRCQLIGELVGEYGAGILTGAGIVKIIKKLRLLKATRGGGRGCFVAGTVIETPEEATAIDELQSGDVVQSYDRSTNQSSDRKVTRTFTRTVSSVLTIHINTTEITCSPEHPFWVPGVGWQEADKLEPGSPLFTKSGDVVRIESIRRKNGSFTVYNIEVEGHTYSVSNLGILVHNKSMEVPKPVGSLKKPSANWLKKQGIDPHTLKDALGGRVSRYDIFKDRNGNLFAKRKGDPDSQAEWLGHIDDFKE